MFNIGDTVFYNSHGVCVIEDIQERTFWGETKSYYILSSYHNAALKLYYPVEAAESQLNAVASKKKAELILEQFKNPAEPWYERLQERHQSFKKILKSNNHIQIAKMINTILRKKTELENQEKKLPSGDQQVLNQVQPILYKELAVSLDISVEVVIKEVEQLIENHS